VSLKPGETKTVTLSLPAKSLAYWNAGTHAWVVEPDQVALQVGGSSADVRLTKTISVR
jgi:beta-glucosidase